MKFLDLPVIEVEPRLVFGTKGELEYFAVSFEERLLGSMVHLHVRRVGELEKSINERPYHTYLLADAPDWCRELVMKPKRKKSKK